MDDKTESAEARGKTAFLPKSIFPQDKEIEPGSVCKFKVVQTFDDDVEVEYVDSEKKEYQEPTQDQQLETLAEQNTDAMI